MAGDIGLGATVAVDDGVSSAYVVFTNVTSITVPNQELGMVENTHLGISNRLKTYTAGLREPGELNFVQHWDKAAYTRALGLINTSHNYKVTFADTSTAVFAGNLLAAETEVAGADQIVEIKCKVKVAGLVVFTAAA